MGASRGWKLAAWTALVVVWTLGSAGCTEPLQGGTTGGPGGTTGGPGGTTGGQGGAGGGSSSACRAGDVIEVGADATFAPTSGPSRARFKAVASTPEVVVATTGAGLHRSKDGGDTWAFVEAKEIKGKKIAALAARGSELFVSIVDTAIYRSTDGGDTWNNVSSPDCAAPTYLSAHGAELYAIALGQPFHWNPATATWEAIPAQSQAFDVIESNGASLYANSLYVPGVFQLDLGAKNAIWTQVNSLPEWGYRAFAFTGDGYGFAANMTHLSRSSDGGKTFAPLDLGADVNIADLFVWNGALFAVTNTDVWVSTDRGDHFKKTPINSTPSGFALASDGLHVFAVSDGVMRATSADGAWEPLHVLADAITSLHATAGSVLSVSESGFLRTTDGGAAWDPVTVEGGASYPSPSSFVTWGGRVFALSGTSTILASDDDGKTFHEVPAEPAKNQWMNFISAIDKGLVVGVSTGAGSGCADAQDVTTTLYLSTDGGGSWTKAMNSFPITFTDCYAQEYTPMIVEVAQAGGALFAATSHTGLYRSVDSGKTWALVPTDKNVGGLFHVGKAGDAVLAAGEHGGVLRSLDGGASFTPSGFEGKRVTSLLSARGTVFAGVEEVEGVEGAVYASSDAGGSWKRVDEGFRARIDALALLDDRLFAGTIGQSTWTAPLRCVAAP